MQSPRASNQAERQRRQTLAERLVRRCAGGDEEALAELHDLYARSLLWFAKRVVRSSEAAEEVVQEVFMYVWEHAERYERSRGTVYTWMCQMARSRAIDRLRRRRTQHRTRNHVVNHASRSVEPCAEHDVYVSELRPRLRRALETLPAAQRQALVLAYYGEMTQREIATRGRIPLGTVKTRTFLALRKLRSTLAGDVAGSQISLAGVK